MIIIAALLPSTDEFQFTGMLMDIPDGKDHDSLFSSLIVVGWAGAL